MRTVLLLALFLSACFGSYEFKGRVGSFYQQNVQVKANKDSFITDIRAELEGKYSNDDESFEAIIALDSVVDPVDSNRRYLYADEAKLKFVGDTYTFTTGYMVLNWGTFETYSALDIFNQPNVVKDPLSMEKLGSLGAHYQYFMDSGELSLSVRFLETLQALPYSKSPYYIYDDDATFSSDFEGINFLRPTLFARYVSTLETDAVSIDYSLLLANGFDKLRGAKRISSTLYQPILFYSTKVGASMTLPLDVWLLKAEGVITLSESTQVAHYGEYGVGVEYSSEIGESSVIYVGEYHGFLPSRSSDTLSDSELFYLLQNDMILGARIGLNDIYNSSLFVGSIIDPSYQEFALQLRYNSKFSDLFSYDIALTTIQSSKINSETLFSRLDTLNAVSVSIYYNF